MLSDLDHLKFPPSDIRLATNNFSPENVISLGTHEKVYKAELNTFFGKHLVNLKVFDQSISSEWFLETIQNFSRIVHPNIISLIGFSDKGDERILCFEHPKYGSLQNYLDNTRLTWTARLKVCIDVSHGIRYLHTFSKRVMHSTIKSSCIHLDSHWKAKIDLGYSNIDLPFEAESDYSDPSRDVVSDIYSLGIVLFEVLCGRLAFDAEYDTDSQDLIQLVQQNYKDGKLEDIIDPFLRNQMAPESLSTFSKIAYQCCNDHPKQGLKMNYIVKQLEESYKLQRLFEQANEGVKRTPIVQDDYYKKNNLEHWIIPSKEIHSAIHFGQLIGRGGFGGVYKAKLFHFDVKKYVRINGSHSFSTGGSGFGGYPRRRSTVAIKKLDSTSRSGQGKTEFLKEIEMLSGYKHRNLVSLLGFCDHDGDMILVYEHASNGSLDKWINNTRVYCLTWAQRLQICLDVAHGLSYLHNVGIIHRDIKSANILLGHNFEGIIGDFGLSRTRKHQNVEFSMTGVAGTLDYIHPVYFRTGKLTMQSDIHSFGVVLWEVLCGKLAILPKDGDYQEYLIHLAKRHYMQNKINLIIDPQLREEFNKSSSIPGNKNFEDSIKTFAAIAYDCLDAIAKKLTMVDVVKELKKAWTFHVTGVEMISLKAINFATSSFNEEHIIGKGTLGKVYTGTLSLSTRPTIVAIKRLEMVGPYEEGGFFKEVAMLSSYIHENIVPFQGFCEEENEMILVFEHANNRSLDKHLDNSTLTWGHRLKISIGVAHGLRYIHSCVKPRKAIHGDIKSSHILLDGVWNATISDLIISKCEGTLGYRDPEYLKTGVLTKESDVYAFGVVLFELLSGRPAIEDVENDQQHTGSRIFNVDPETSEERKNKDEKVVFLAQLAALCFEDRKLEEIIFHGIKEKADPNSIDIFSAIAYQCLQQNKENRPTMARVIEELERAFKSHDEWEWEQKLPTDYNRIIKMSKHPVPSSTTKKDLHCLLSSGILLSKENVWFSISMHGVKCEMVPATKFSYGNASSLKWASIRKSRFPKVAKILDVLNLNIQIKIRPQFLTLEKTYGAYLVFTFCDPRNISCMPLYINLKYKKKGEALNTYFAQWKTENKWLMVELFRFVNKDQTTDFEVLLESFSRYHCGSWAIFIEGIEFRPVTVDAVVNKEIKDEKDVQGVYQSKSDMDLEEKLGNDYHQVINRSQSNPVNTSKEELNALLSKGILIDEGEKLLAK